MRSGTLDMGKRHCICLALVVLAFTKGSVAGIGASKVEREQASRVQTQTFAETSEYFDGIYRDFYKNYRLGPGDEIAVRVVGQPDFSLESVRISPVGRIYHPLVGDIHVARLTVDELTTKLVAHFSEYILNPSVSVELLTAHSAKVGVLGEVVRPGIVVMDEPMTLLGAIIAAGGATDSGKKSEVTLLRQNNEGRLRIVTVNLKRILEGRADPEQNLALRAGDTLIVHGNLRKKITSLSVPLMGFTQLLYFLSLAR